MYCQICKQNEATIHLTEINSGVRSEMHVCANCAQKQGIAVNSQVPLNELLSNLLASQPSDEEIFDLTSQQKVCPKCGYTIEQFTQEALLGCQNDYDVFEEQLVPLIKKAHNGNISHCGKIPSKVPAEKKRHMQLTKLQQQLTQAVNNEEYEIAAQLRDKINKIQSDLP